MEALEHLPPQTVIMQMMNGAIVSRCVTLVAELGVADLLQNGPKDIASLATATDTDPDALYRVLRLLAGMGIFVEFPRQQFQQSPLSEVLCSDAPGSVRPSARWSGTDLRWHCISNLEYSVRTRQPVATKDQPDTSVFDVIAQDAHTQATFNEAMTQFSMEAGAAIVEAYDFSPFAHITDVGGGHGTLAMMIAQSAPSVHVTVFDLPHVIEGTTKHLGTNVSTANITTMAGSFFDQVPKPTNLCILRHILHDWEDAEATRILTRCREALGDNGRVLVCEMLITPDPEGLQAKIVDIEMLVLPGGRERTEAEFAALFHRAGLQLTRVVATRAPVRLLEATPI